MGFPTRKYAIFVESESIIPKEYDIFNKHKGIEKEFISVLTYSEKLLDKLPNAVFFNGGATIWYGREIYNGQPDPVVYRQTHGKTKPKTSL